jgi:hypothetical protein
MKKLTLAALLLIATASTLLIGAGGYGYEYEYYSDATYANQVGYRGTMDCLGSWGSTSIYRIGGPCR